MNFAPIKLFESNAKLMLTGEYVVLKGALSLGLPLKYGQKLSVEENEGKPSIIWKSLINNNLWFSTTLLLPHLRIMESNFQDLSETICKILSAARLLNPGFLELTKEYHITSWMDFNPAWGIGASSSLISNIAAWAGCDPFELNKLIFNGSGYDIACARSSSPIIYLIKDGKPYYRKSNFYPVFHHQLFFVYLNRKQNSKESIQKLDLTMVTPKDIKAISELTLTIEKTDHLATFQSLIEQHEEIISKIINKQPVKTEFFSDFNGSIKSLGAWGGDFILAASSASEEYIRCYFTNKNLTTIFRYDEIVL
jgi:mevalonate kinase